MGKSYRAAGAFIIVFMIIGNVLCFTIELADWLFAVLFDVVCISVIVLLFSFGNHLEENNKQIEDLDRKIQTLLNEQKTEIVYPQDIQSIAIRNASVRALYFRQGMFVFDEFMTLPKNVTKAIINGFKVEVTIFDRTFYFEFSEITRKEAENICGLLNSIINKK